MFMPRVYFCKRAESGINSFIVFFCLAFRVLIDQFSFLSFLRKFFPLQNFTFHIQSVTYRLFCALSLNKNCNGVSSDTCAISVAQTPLPVYAQRRSYYGDFVVSGVHFRTTTLFPAQPALSLWHLPSTLFTALRCSFFNAYPTSGVHGASNAISLMPTVLPLPSVPSTAPITFTALFN